MQESHIQLPPHPLPVGGIIDENQNPDLDPNQDASLCSSLAKVSVLWEKQASEANNKSMSKTPRWER
jgi:hypothetical protein